MTLKGTYSALARKDLGSIRNWTRDNFGADQAKTYIRQIAASLQMISENPGLARNASDIRPDLRPTATLHTSNSTTHPLLSFVFCMAKWMSTGGFNQTRQENSSLRAAR
jgi:plasmid stabilization system protein ParE